MELQLLQAHDHLHLKIKTVRNKLYTYK